MKPKLSLCLTVFLIVSLVLSPAIFIFVGALDATNTWQVGQSSDDCYRRLVSSAFALVSTSCYCGDSSSTSYDYCGGMRFTNVNIPQGSTINSAYLKLKAKGKDSSIPQTFIEGEDNDNAATFSTAGDYDSRPRTSANVSWTPLAWVDGTWYTSSDIKTVVQEIVDRGGWTSGNALVLFWRDAAGWGGVQNRAYAYSYDAGAANAPKLEVTWTEVGGEAYTADLTQSLSTSWSLSTQTIFNTISTQAITTTWQVIIQTSFNVITSLSNSFTWIVDIVHTLAGGINYVVDLTQALTLTWTILTQWNGIIDLSQSLSTTWTVLLQSTFNVAATLTGMFTWVVDVVKGVMHAWSVDLTLSIVTSWIVDTLHTPWTTIYATKGFVIAILFLVGFIFAVPLILVLKKVRG